MNAAYLDCASGISGDMMLGALIDAGVPLETLQAGIDSLGMPSCRLVVAEVKKNAFRALQVTVQHAPEHAHRHLHHIAQLIDGSTIEPRARKLAHAIFRRLAEAEARVHGTDVEKVHFHEVGAVDSIADIVGTAIGWCALGIERAFASPVPPGRGFIQIAHGRCAIPAPATAELLKGIPFAESSVEGELTTPTGAAILATLVDAFGPPPAITVRQIGYGAGQRDYADHANLLRLLVGEETPRMAGDSVWVVETNLDDSTGEQIGYCCDRLWAAGALDVATSPIQMKKARPGVRLTALCRQADVGEIERILLCETTTLGVRRYQVERTIL
ncbi:MAG: nickel pincer cofactor biosynthesis protein LarC, partial [Pirellulales bacterium]